MSEKYEPTQKYGKSPKERKEHQNQSNMNIESI